MPRNARVILALAAAVIVLGTMVGYGVVRLRDWDRRGTIGVTYMPPIQTKSGKAPPTIWGIKPSSVFMTYPGSPAANAGIKSGDPLVSINGIPIKDQAALSRLDKRLKTGDVVTYRVGEGKSMRDVTMRLASPIRLPVFVASLAISSFVALAFVGIGLLVFMKNPHDRRVLVFYAMVIVGALYVLAAPALALDASNMRGIAPDPSGSNLLPAMALLTTISAFLPLTLHLALVFPRDRPILQSSPRVLRWVYGVPALLVLAFGFMASLVMVLGATGKSGVRNLDLPLNILFGVLTFGGLVVALRIARRGREEGVWRAFWNRPLQSILVALAVFLGIARVAAALDIKWLAFTSGTILVAIPCLFLFLGFPILSCVALYRSYRESGPEERRQVKWPLWGLLIAIGGRILVSLVAQLVGAVLMLSHGDMATWMTTSQLLDVAATMLYLLIPISFAFAILKYRLMNIDVIIRKTVVYAILSGAIIVVYLGLVGGLGTILVNVAGVKNQTMVIASTLVVALLFVPLRNKLQTLVDRNLFRHKYDYPEALKAIAAETLTANDLGEFLTSVAEKTQQALQNRSVVAFISRHDEFVAAAKVGVADSLLGTLRIAREPLLPMLERPFDPRRHPLSDDAAAALKRIDAVLVAPVNTPGSTANGFLALAAKLTDAPFDVEDIDFLRLVATQTDIGVDRIRQQREEADYEQARAIQQTLLPREMPRVAGLDLSGMWLPARTMGGDYYDLLELGPNELAVCIGDVAGKGMPAALLMSGLQAAVRASASGSPRDLCERVRRVVVSSLSGGRFVTFFYATVDTAAMRLRWCNAGHNAPVLVRADGNTVRLSGGGPAFSRLFRDDRYEEHEIAIAAGDRLVCFTDGVSEASGGDGEMFGEPLIEALVVENRTLGARALQQSIVEAATTFSGGELDDDLTLVVVAVM